MKSYCLYSYPNVGKHILLLTKYKSSTTLNNKLVFIKTISLFRNTNNFTFTNMHEVDSLG